MAEDKDHDVKGLGEDREFLCNLFQHGVNITRGIARHEVSNRIDKDCLASLSGCNTNVALEMFPVHLLPEIKHTQLVSYFIGSFVIGSKVKLDTRVVKDTSCYLTKDTLDRALIVFFGRDYEAA